MILDKVEKNKAALLLGLTYLNRYYGVKFDDVNIKESCSSNQISMVKMWMSLTV